jgi:hypothetical protein
MHQMFICISDFRLLKKNFEENMQEQEIDLDLFNAVPSSLTFNFYEILRGHFTNLNFFEIAP